MGTTPALVIDCHNREWLGELLSRGGKARTASIAREYAFIARFGTLGCLPAPLLVRTDDGPVFTS